MDNNHHHQSSGEGDARGGLNSSGKTMMIPRAQVLDVLKNLNVGGSLVKLMVDIDQRRTFQ